MYTQNLPNVGSVVDIPRALFDLFAATHGRSTKDDVTMLETETARTILRPLFCVGGLAIQHSREYLEKINTSNLDFHATLALTLSQSNDCEQAELKLYTHRPRDVAGLELFWEARVASMKRIDARHHKVFQECTAGFSSFCCPGILTLNLRSRVAQTAAEMVLAAAMLAQQFHQTSELPTAAVAAET